MAYASFKYLSDRERKRVEKKRQKREREREREYLLTLEKKSRVKHDKVYRAPNRASGNTKSIHPDVREQYLKQKREDYIDKELTKNPLPSLKELTGPPPPSQVIENYYKLNPREPVTNTKETKQGQEEMSQQLREALGHPKKRVLKATYEKIDPEKVLKTRNRYKGGRKNKTRRKKRTRRRRKKRRKKKNRKKRTKRR